MDQIAVTTRSHANVNVGHLRFQKRKKENVFWYRSLQTSVSTIMSIYSHFLRYLQMEIIGQASPFHTVGCQNYILFSNRLQQPKRSCRAPIKYIHLCSVCLSLCASICFTDQMSRANILRKILKVLSPKLVKGHTY